MDLHRWAVAAEGAYDDGIVELERGLELSLETGAHMDDPYYFALLADARARAGRTVPRRARAPRVAQGRHGDRGGRQVPPSPSLLRSG